MLLPCQTKNVTSQNECVTTIPKVTHGNIVSKFTFLARASASAEVFYYSKLFEPTNGSRTWTGNE